MDHLARAQEDDGIIDFSVVVDTSDLGRIKALTVLHELYMRIAQAEPIKRSRITTQHAQLENTQEITSKIPTRGKSMPVVSLQGGKVQEWLAKWRRRSTSSAKGSSKMDSDLYMEVVKHESVDQAEGSPRKEMSTSLPLSPSPLSPVEPNPWLETPPILITDHNPLISPISQASPTSPRPSLHVSSGSRPRSKRTSDTTASLDYCKGANYLQRGFPKDAFKRTNQSVSMQGENYYWRCGNKQCVFYGPAVKSGKEWHFNNDILRCSGAQGMEYRWSYLAKSHVPLGKVKGGWSQHTFKCFMCYLQGNSQSIFQGSRSFLEHTALHAGKYVHNTCIQGPLVLRAEMIRSLSDKDSERFDVNVLPKVEKGDADPFPASSEVDVPEEKGSWYRPRNDADSTSMNPWEEP